MHNGPWEWAWGPTKDFACIRGPISPILWGGERAKRRARAWRDSNSRQRSEWVGCAASGAWRSENQSAWSGAISDARAAWPDGEVGHANTTCTTRAVHHRGAQWDR